MNSPKPNILRGLAYLVLIVHSLVVILPIALMVLSAFKSTPEVLFKPLALPQTISMSNFIKVWNETDFLVYVRNSIVVTTLSVLLILVLGSMAAYALARFRFRVTVYIYGFFLIGLTLPMKLGILPLFFLIKRLGLMDSLWSLVAVYTAIGLPFSVMVLTGFLRQLPLALDEAARLDGCSDFRLLISILLPVSKPALATVGIYNLVNVWNDFFFPLIFIRSNALKTIPLGMTVFFGEYETDWSLLFTGLMFASAPLIIMYVLMSRQFISGLTSGAVKS